MKVRSQFQTRGVPEKKTPIVYTLPCGCNGDGARCDREGTLYAELESARLPLLVLGVDVADPDALAAAPPGLAARLIAARRDYAAHFDVGGRWLPKHKAAPNIPNADDCPVLIARRVLAGQTETES